MLCNSANVFIFPILFSCNHSFCILFVLVIYCSSPPPFLLVFALGPGKKHVSAKNIKAVQNNQSKKSGRAGPCPPHLSPTIESQNWFKGTGLSDTLQQGNKARCIPIQIGMHTWHDIPEYLLVLFPCLILFALLFFLFTIKKPSFFQLLSNIFAQDWRLDPIQLWWSAANCSPLMRSGTGCLRGKVHRSMC